MSTERQLSPQQVEAFGAEIDALRQRTMAQVGAADARYIRRIRSAVRWSELLGRALLMLGWFPPTWLLGALLLALGKVLENMELGHNVMHGQYDWMNEPEFSGQHYEWDHACPSEFWRQSHNYQHHTFTNIIGKDSDIGYGTVRVFPQQRWYPFYLLQPLWATLQAVLFQHAVAIYDLKLDRYFRGRLTAADLAPKMPPFKRKLLRQTIKDYLLFPLLAGPHFLPVLAGNLLANLLRNLWTFAVIFCGHFTEHAEVFPASVLKNESRGHWCLRQLRGSSNLSGGRLFHILTGNLSHQIEHHLFPDVPACRYRRMAVEVREICQRYGLRYNTGRFTPQFFGVLRRIMTYGWAERRLSAA